MTTVDIFYQGEGIREIAHFEADADHTFAILKRTLIDKHDLDKETLIYLEDRDDPVDEAGVIREHIERAGIKAHLHRCHHVGVEVIFDGEMVHHRLGPGTTVARVKTWAAEDKFGMSPADAAEHVLQIAGTQDRPDPGTHLGALTHYPACRIAFDLVPNERVNGHATFDER